jgi:hypothetical protein
MTTTKRKFLVRRVAASMVVVAVLAFGLLRAFAGGAAQAPPDAAAAFVPRNANVYLHLFTDRGTTRWKRTQGAIRKLPTVGLLRDSLVRDAQGEVGDLNLTRDTPAWLGNEAALAVLPGSERLVLLKVKDRSAAERSLARAAGTGRTRVYRGVRLREIGGGRVAGFDDGFLLAGKPSSVQQAIDAHAGSGASLGGDKTYEELRNGLPHDRLANAYLSGSWISSHLAGPAAVLTGAARVPSLQSAAVSFGVEGKRMRVALRGRPAPGVAPGQGCTGKTGGGSGLLGKAPAHPALFVGLAGMECVLRELAASPDSGAGKALRDFASRAQKSGVNVQNELLPLLGSDSALSVIAGAAAPTVTLEVGDVPPDQAMNVLGRLQPVLLGLFKSQRTRSTPDFSTATVAGVTALTATLSPAFQLSYAAFDDDVVVSTALAGIAAARKGQHLDETGDFKTVLGDRPKSPSALVFLDLEKALALADQAGLGSNPTYSALRDDLQKVGAAGAVLSREGDDIDAELRLKNP